MNFLLPAIRQLGEKVMDSEGESVGTAAADFGRRLLHALISRRSDPDQEVSGVPVLLEVVERRTLAVAREPDQRTAVQLEGAIEDLLNADSTALAVIAALLERVPSGGGRQQDRSSHVGGDNSGVIITGDGNAVTGR
jgi:hypothetical protein